MMLLCNTSCSRFLDVDTIGKATIETFFSDYQGLETAFVGMYSRAGSFYDSYAIIYPELAGDLLDLQIEGSELQRAAFNFTSIPSDNSGYPRYIWKEAYDVVTNANNIIYYGDILKGKFPVYEDKILEIIAHAYYIRALMFFHLASAYSQNYTYSSDASHLGVPVPNRPLGFNEKIARPTLAKSYEQILSDVLYAKNLMLQHDSKKGPYYASADACSAFLARIYLYMGNYTEAEKYSSEIMSKYDLSSAKGSNSDYEMMWRYPHMNIGEETIFRFTNFEHSSTLANNFNPATTTKMLPSKKLLDLFDGDNDIRRKRLLYYDLEYEGYKDGLHSFSKNACMKYYVNDKYKIDNNGIYGHSDPVVFRCSEMYLIHAECLCNRENPDLEGAVNDIKALIARATGVEKENVVLSYSSKDDVNLLIEKERMKELCFEGHRLYDITRRHKAVERDSTTTSTCLKVDYPNYRLILPICQLEMDANDAMEQNEGYGKR